MNAVNEDAVIFVSSGVTGAIHKLIHGMNLKDIPVCILSKLLSMFSIINVSFYFLLLTIGYPRNNFSCLSSSRNK